MKRSSQNNRSALIVAGQNSLSKIDQQHNNYYTTLESHQNNHRSNQALYESNVKQVYKRPGYNNNEDLPYRPENTQKSKVNFKTHTQNNQMVKMSRRNYQQQKHKNTNSLQLQSKQLSQMYKTSPNKNISQSYYSLYKIDPQRIKKIMMKLTYGRLRKMQALVRGFLVRRIVYPKLLEEYLIAKSVLSLIQANVVYRQISTIIMQTLTFPKYQDQGQLAEMYKGRQKVLQDLVYESIVFRVIQKQIKPIIQQSLTQRGLLMNRPQINFGFNLRDPLELVLYEKLLGIMVFQLKNTCEQSIKQQAMDRRELFVIDQWIQNHNMLKPLYEQIANQLLEENIGEYIVQDILQKLVREGAFVVAQNVYNNQVNDWYMKTVQQIKGHVQQAVIQQAFAQALIQMGFGIEKQNQTHQPL